MLKGKGNTCLELSDKEIIILARKDIEYFACLYERYEKRMIRYIIKISGFTIEETEDILQDSFLKIWKNLNEYDDTLKFSSWIYRIVHNETISHWRKKKSHAEYKNALPIADVENIYASIEEKEADTDQRKKINNVINRLKKEYREVLVLKFLENLSYEEISDILKIPEGTVATRINRAKKAFRLIAGEKTNFFN
jgi:RNA polymerase sigma-70 factor (ECF subfamily)